MLQLRYWMFRALTLGALVATSAVVAGWKWNSCS
jgi:hypothetical protein